MLASLTTVWEHRFPMQLGVMFPLILGHLRGQNISDMHSSESWMQKILGRDRQWKMEVYWRHRGEDKRGRYSVYNMANVLINLAIKPLKEALKDDAPNKDFPHWQAYQIIDDEYSERSTAQSWGNERSVIMSYPDLIRHAGRLSI